jgi:hypothetical protein
MSKLLIVRLSFFVLVTSGAGASTLVWDKLEAYLEMTPEQEEARATFKVTNKGEKTLRIADIKTSCGCTSSIINGKILEPGATKEIVGVFNKGKRQGQNRYKLRVYLDKLVEPVATLSMNVRIPTLIEAKPQLVYWKKGSAKSARRIRLVIDSNYIDEILRIDFDPERLRVTDEPSTPESGLAKVLIVEPKSYDLPYRGAITVYGSGPKGRKAQTRVHTFVQP